MKKLTVHKKKKRGAYSKPKCVDFCQNTIKVHEVHSCYRA